MQGVWCTSPGETLLGLAADLSPRPGCRAASRVLPAEDLLELAVEAAIHRHLVTVEQLRDLCALAPGAAVRAGRRWSRCSTGGRPAADGELPPDPLRAADARCRARRPSTVRSSCPIGQGCIGRVDLHRDGVVVELVGREWHLDRFAHDHRRYARLTGAGYQLLPFTFDDVEVRPGHVVADDPRHDGPAGGRLSALSSPPTAAACAQARRRCGARTRRPPARRSSSGLLRVAEQVADHADAVGLRQLDQHDDVGALLGQRRVHRVPDALVAVDHALGRRLLVAQVEGVAVVAEPLGSPLPAVARVAALQQQLARRARPSQNGRVEAVGRRHRRRQARAAGTASRHSVASLPKIDELTGVTIGPGDHQRDVGAGHLRGRLAADLAHRLDVQLEAVHVALGQVAAAGVERQLAARARAGCRR